MRILVFAGVFDPIHIGHMEVLKKALSEHGEDNTRAVVVAEKLPQHKHGTTPYHHRFAMLELAFADNRNVEVLEAPISEHTVLPFFTWLTTRFPSASFSWVVGSDVLPHMEKWADIEKLESLNVGEILCFMRDKEKQLEINVVKSTPVKYLKCSKTYAGISSRKIRESYSEKNQSLDPRVVAYIEKFNLY